MPIKVLANQDGKSKSSVQICETHREFCEKYPDHPLVRERASAWKPDPEFMEMLYGGRFRQRMEVLVAAGFELPEEFTRGAEDPVKNGRARLFFETYDLCRHFPADPVSKPPPCKPRKLSPEEVRERIEWAETAREARSRRQPFPTPPWEGKTNLELAALIYSRDTSEYYRTGWLSPKDTELSEALAADDELRRKLAGAVETWVNSPRRVPKHTQDVREGYGDAVPEFEEME
ncbi:hypothetical protein ACFYUL_23955 [Streptomyces sp. NPDC004311]|uniref:hypothetical protein n=1 Tax=Streptomyces sp. NPDC004311 TaxID=3364698 RepID=UPI0036C89220